MSKRQWCRINAKAGEATEILIYDVIGSYWMDTDAQTIATQIKSLDTDEIVVRINSPGGDAFDGIAIMNALRAHSATVIVRVDGLAASAASVIAMAGDEIIMGEGAQMMIHEAWLYTQGSADYLRSEADRLDKMTDSITSLYARRAGGEFDEWRALVAAETWFTAEEAVAAGLADRVGTTAPESGELAAAFNLSQFRFAGRDHAPAPRIPSAEAVEVTNRRRAICPPSRKPSPLASASVPTSMTRLWSPRSTRRWPSRPRTPMRPPPSQPALGSSLSIVSSSRQCRTSWPRAVSSAPVRRPPR
ncbi:hypothetical protein GS876_20985 [Rhodococcus hoagii]|nr:hypothetical protein [Prescottella equi]